MNNRWVRCCRLPRQLKPCKTETEGAEVTVVVALLPYSSCSSNNLSSCRMLEIESRVASAKKCWVLRRRSRSPVS